MWEQDCGLSTRHHPRRRRVPTFCGDVSGIDVIRAAGARRGLAFRKRRDLSCLSGPAEFAAEMLKVFLADLQLQDFLDHRGEVCQ